MLSTNDNRIIAGKKGEDKISKTLLLHQHMIGVEGEAFDDYCFEVGKNGSCEIDCLYVSTIGIFIIEVKYWGGTISGSVDKEDWLQIRNGRGLSRRFLKNPIKQNEGHYKNIKYLLNKDYPIYPIVVFAANNAPNIKGASIINYNQMVQYVDHIRRTGPKISKQDVDSLVALFKAMRKNFGVSKAQHIQNIRKLHR